MPDQWCHLLRGSSLRKSPSLPHLNRNSRNAHTSACLPLPLTVLCFLGLSETLICLLAYFPSPLLEHKLYLNGTQFYHSLNISKQNNWVWHLWGSTKHSNACLNNLTSLLGHKAMQHSTLPHGFPVSYLCKLAHVAQLICASFSPYAKLGGY